MESWDPPFLRDDASGNVDCLATLTANNKKESGALFRCFNNLTWRLLLEQEIRISNLASELSEIDKECNENKLRGMTLSELDGLANQWEAYKTDEDEEEPLSRSPARIAYKRKELIHLIDQGLRAYHANLSRVAYLNGLNRPKEQRLQYLRGKCIRYSGTLRHRLDDDADLIDLVPLPALSTPAPIHTPTQLTSPAQPRHSGKRSRQFAEAYSNIFRKESFDEPMEKRLHLILSALTIFLAALFIVGAMIMLFFIESNNAKLAIVCVLTVVLPVCLVALTDIKREELFIASATYAAVLVVFLASSSVLGPTPLQVCQVIAPPASSPAIPTSTSSVLAPGLVVPGTSMPTPTVATLGTSTSSSTDITTSLSDSITTPLPTLSSTSFFSSNSSTITSSQGDSPTPNNASQSNT